MILAHIRRRLWFYMLLLAVVGAAGAFWRGHMDGYADCRAKQIQEALNATDERTRIANNRPDLDGVVMRLREGSF